jgi:hypothetical protein
VESKDVTLDDIWKLDLIKLDGWTCVKENTVGEEFADNDQWSTDTGSDRDESDEEEGGTS